MKSSAVRLMVLGSMVSAAVAPIGAIPKANSAVAGGYLAYQYMTGSDAHKALANRVVSIAGITALGSGVTATVGWFTIAGMIMQKVSAGVAAPIILGTYASGLVFAGAVIVLNDNSPYLQLQELTPEQAASMGMSSEELEVYNRNIDVVRALLADIEEKVASEVNQGLGHQDIEGAVARAWKQAFADLRMDAGEKALLQSAMIKMSKAFMKSGLN